MMDDEEYIQVCDRTKLTAKRSLELEEEGRNWAVSRILGEVAMDIEEEEEENSLSLHTILSACGKVVECLGHERGGVEVAFSGVTH